VPVKVDNSNKNLQKELNKQIGMIDKFDKDYAAKVQTFTTAGQSAARAISSIKTGIERLAVGDELGGAASLLDGVGQLANVAALLGPAGAAAGAILSIITGIISAIMEALNPQKESLEAKIEKFIREQDLKNEGIDLKSSEDSWITYGELNIEKMANARKAVAKAMDAGKTFVTTDVTDDMYFPDGYSPEDGVHSYARMREGMAWDKLVSVTQVVDRVSEIDHALTYLKNNTDLYSQRWNALIDQTVGYMYRMWISVHGLAGLVNKEGHGAFVGWRDGVARIWKEMLKLMEYKAQNNCQIYARWHSGSTETFDWWKEQIYWRVGVLGKSAPGFEKAGDNNVVNFAVSSRGTIFSASNYFIPGPAAGDREFPVARVGRRGTDWLQAKDRQACEQIFIGELPDIPDTVFVACTHGDGHKLSISAFNEALGVGGDDRDAWTPNADRWGAWTHWTHDEFIIASLALAPVGEKSYAIYALGLNEDLSATLYELNWDANIKPKPVEGFSWKKEEVEAAGAMNLVDSGKWSATPSYSCAISLAPFAVQLGNKVRIKKGKNIADWDNWDLTGKDYINAGNLKTHQGRFYGDGTFVTCSNLGVYMRYWNSDKSKFEWAHDSTIETEIIQKISLHNGALYRALQDKVGAPAK
jgi:hypothetical protein